MLNSPWIPAGTRGCFSVCIPTVYLQIDIVVRATSVYYIPTSRAVEREKKREKHLFSDPLAFRLHAFAGLFCFLHKPTRKQERWDWKMRKKKQCAWSAGTNAKTVRFFFNRVLSSHFSSISFDEYREKSIRSLCNYVCGEMIVLLLSPDYYSEPVTV
jgi:hypothetical protein